MEKNRKRIFCPLARGKRKFNKLKNLKMKMKK